MREGEVIHSVKTDEEPESALVVHRNFPGQHVFEGTSCWCSPELVKAGDDVDLAIERLERTDG